MVFCFFFLFLHHFKCNAITRQFFIPVSKRGKIKDSFKFSLIVKLEQNTIEFQLEGTSNDYLVQLPSCFRPEKMLQQIIRGLVQMPLQLVSFKALRYLWLAS